MADPTVKVVIEVDDTNARKAILGIGEALAKLRTTSRRVSGEIKESSREATTQLKKQREATDNVSTSTKRLGSAAKGTSTNIRGLAQASQNFLRTTLSSITGVSQLAKQLVVQAQAAGLNSTQIRSVAQATSAFSGSQINSITRSAQLTERINALNNELREGKINTAQYTRQLATLANEFRDVSTSARRAKVEQDRLNTTQSKSRGILEGAIGSYVKLRIALDAVRQVAQAVNRAFSFAEQGAQIQQTRVSFNNFATEIAGLPNLLNDLTEAADGTVSQFQLMTSTLTLTAGVAPDVATELAQASPELLEIARAAAIINPALGDTQVLFDRLALGIKRSSSRILDDLGIIVKLGEANQRFADLLGKTVAELTAEERQIALLNETLRAGQNLINQAGDAAENTIDPFLRLRASTEELTNVLKEAAADGLRPFIVELDKLISKTAQEISLVGDENFFRGQASAIANAATEVGGLSLALERLQEAQRILRPAEAEQLFFERTGRRQIQDPLGFTLFTQGLKQLREAAKEEQDKIIRDAALTTSSLQELESELGTAEGLISFRTGQVDVDGLEREELEELLSTQITTEGELSTIIIDVDVLARLRELNEIEAKSAVAIQNLIREDFGLARALGLVSSSAAEATDEQRAYIKEIRAAQEATRDFAISAVESSGKVDEFGKLILETADELNLTEDEVLDLALSLGILDEETFQNAQTLIAFNKLLADLAPALAAGGEEAEEAERQIAAFLDALPEDGEIRLTIETQLAGVSQDFVAEQIDLFTQLAEEQAKLDELTEVTEVPAGTVIARLEAKIAADLTDEEVRELEDRLQEDIPDAERLAIEARLDLDLTDDEVRDFRRRIAEIRESGIELVGFIAGTTKEIQAQEEAIQELNNAIAENFLRSIFEATVAQKGWNEETLQFGLALGVINPDIEDQIRGAIQLGEEFEELVDLLDARGITLGSKAAAEAFEALDLGKTAEEALAAAEALISLERGTKRAASEARTLRDQSLFEIEGVIPPALREPIEQDRPTFLNLALPEEFTEEVNEVEKSIERLTETENIINVALNDAIFAELEAILTLVEQIANVAKFPPGTSSPSVPGADFRQFGGNVRPGQPTILGEVRPEVAIPQIPLSILSRVPAGFNRALGAVNATAPAPTINNTSIDNSRSVQNTNTTTNALSIQVPNPTEAIEVVRNVQGGTFIG